MPLIFGCFAVLFPRLALVLLWLLGDGYLGRAFESGVWIVLGFVFMPLSTLAFAFAMNSLGGPGEIPPLGWVLIIVAVLADFGLIGSGRSSARRHFARNDET